MVVFSYRKVGYWPGNKSDPAHISIYSGSAWPSIYSYAMQTTICASPVVFGCNSL